MAPDKQQDIPDPLRSLKVGDVVAVTGHSSFEKPAGIEDQAWAAAIEEVRTAVRTVRLDVPIAADVTNFLPGVCREVDQRVKAYKGEGNVDKKRLHDPVIDAVREQIGLFLSVRIRLGRNEKFKELIKVLRKAKGSVSIAALEKEHDLKAIVATMRTIVKDASNTAARKEAIWKYIKEFLAEQAGLEKVEFPGQTFTDERPVDDIKRQLGKLGITLTHDAAIERKTGRLDRLHDETLDGVREHIAAIDQFLKDLRNALERAQGAERLLSMRMTEAERGPLQDFKRRERELKLARETLLEALGMAELAPKDERAHRARLTELEEEFAEPLRTYRELEASMEEIAGRVEGMQELDAELREKVKKLRQLEAMLRVVKFMEEEEPSVAAVAGGVPDGVATRPASAPTPGAAVVARGASPALLPSAASRPGRPSIGGAFLRATDSSRPATDDRSPLRITRHPLPPDAPRTTSDGRFSVDDKVSHRSLGRGTVVGVEQDKAVVKVQFERDGVGTKNISYTAGDFLTKVE